jgi:hypothetical protein
VFSLDVSSNHALPLAPVIKEHIAAQLKYYTLSDLDFGANSTQITTEAHKA